MRVLSALSQYSASAGEWNKRRGPQPFASYCTYCRRSRLTSRFSGLESSLCLRVIRLPPLILSVIRSLKAKIRACTRDRRLSAFGNLPVRRYSLQMPVISRFLGIAIAILYRDHDPPHFHAIYGEYEITVTIVDGVVNGQFPRRALSHVLDWYQQHRDELMLDWEQARRHEPLSPIPPLE